MPYARGRYMNCDLCGSRDVDVIDRARIVFTFCWAEFSVL
jgi:hypothetical protein